MNRAPVKRLCEISYGLGQPPPLSDSGVPILRATNISRGRIVPKDLIFASVDELPLDRAPLLAAGEILVVRSGAYTGDSALITDEWEGSSPGYDLRLTPGRRCEPRFLSYCLLSQEVSEQILLASARAAQPHLNAEELGEIRVPLPPLDVQRRIADFLDDQVARIDQLVGLRAKQAALVGEVFQARIDDLYRAESNPPLRSLLAQDPCYGVLVPEFTEATDGVPLIRINNLLRPSAEVDQMPRIAARQSKEYRRTVVRPGDVLLSVVGSLDKAAIVPPEWSGANVNRPVARLVPREGIPPEVIYGWTMTSAYMRDALLVTGAGTAQATLNMGDLRRFRVPVPQDVLALAGRVRALLDWRRAAVAGVETSTSLLEERKRSLITAAVTGGFDITTGSSRHTA